ncbi:hypothetical protein GCM10027059_37840 [Myceligenerans halotolerans]
MTALAENLARLRKARDLSQDVLAAKARVGVDTVARIERGTRTTCRPATLSRLATALETTVQALLSDGSSSRTEPFSPSGVIGLRQAITSSGVVPGLPDFAESNETVSLDVAERQAAEVWRLYVDGRHDELLALLPAVLTDARRLVDSCTGDEAAAAHRALATVYRVGAGIAGRLGKEDLAWTAAERALTASHNSDAPGLQEAISLRYLAWTLVRQGRSGEAEQLAIRAAEAVQPRLFDSDPDP